MLAQNYENMVSSKQVKTRQQKNKKIRSDKDGKN